MGGDCLVQMALSLSDGNSTLRISSFGLLLQFALYNSDTRDTGYENLLALDTGNDLVWIPCNCVKSASTDDSPYSAVQTGFFLDIAAPDGLFGLGFGKISVPSILSRGSYVSDSFSLCFGYDGTGRINFGDEGSLDQEETPFSMNTFHVIVTQVHVETNDLDSNFIPLFDSGTSFTYLVDPLYTMLSESFNSYPRDKRLPPDSRLPFEYCYAMSPVTNTSLIPAMSLIRNGGARLIVHDPIVVISSPVRPYCKLLMFFS